MDENKHAYIHDRKAIRKIVKTKKCFLCNCSRCDCLHIWSQKTAEDFKMRYDCRQCGLENKILKKDLK